MWSGNKNGENPISPEAELVQDHSFLWSGVISKGDGISILVEHWKCYHLEGWKLSCRHGIQLEEGIRGTSEVTPGCLNHCISFLPNWGPQLLPVLHAVNKVDHLKHRSDHCIFAFPRLQQPKAKKVPVLPREYIAVIYLIVSGALLPYRAHSIIKLLSIQKSLPSFISTSPMSWEGPLLVSA